MSEIKSTPNIDFGDGPSQSVDNNTNPSVAANDITGNQPKPGEVDITAADNNNDNNNNNPNPEGNNNNNPEENKDNGNEPANPSTGELEPGTIINFDGQDYTVSENGDIVDKDGNVFKKADEVQAWLDENNAVDDNSLEGISVKDIINNVGIEVKDENGNDIEFTDDKEGLKSYIEAVAQLNRDEGASSSLNSYFANNPIVKQFVDYITVNGGDPTGFGQIPDRSGITVDKDNELQQEQIIRVAGKELGMNITEAYLKYLKDSGGLYDEAVNQLQALVEKDKDVRTRIEQNAALQRKAEEDAVRAYWENVNNVISSRKIAGYKIPESFVKEVNGQKINLTPDDFYDYLYKAREVDANGNKITGYQRDLDKLTDEELLNKELLDAWLMFTGGTYKDLVNMAVKEHEVHKLVVKSKQNRAARTIKINKPQEKGNVNSIVFE